MKKRIFSWMLATLMIGMTVASPVMAASMPANDEEIWKLNREDVQLGEPYADETLGETFESAETDSVAVDISGNGLSGNDILMEEEKVYSYSGALSLAKPSKSTIANQYRNLYSYGLNYAFYQTTPLVTPPYSAGALSTLHLQKAMESVNMMRMIAGLPSVGHNPVYTVQAQQGAVVLAANNALDHYPAQPLGMNQNFYTAGRLAAKKSNIASGTYQSWRSLAWFTQNYMEDKSAGNLASVGHRRWILNPAMGSTGFGYATNKSNMTYALMYVEDAGMAVPDYDFISWPASGNFPQEFCMGDTPWSVTLNPDKFDVYNMNLNNVKVSITAPNGKVQTFSAADNQTDTYDVTKPYFNIDFGGTGVRNAIIFKPGTAAFGTGKPSGVYSVNIEGIKERNGTSAIISYNVEFFNATDYLGGTNDQAINEEPITVFVNRLYAMCLGRQAEDKGLADWKDSLVTKRKSGAEVAYGFFFSKELYNKHLSDADFVELLYRVMMNRPSDAAGKADWLSRLAAGATREGVYKGFAESKEFGDICNSYGIVRGTVNVSQGRDRNTGVTIFVSRLYTKALGRKYDISGLNEWCNRIIDKKWSVTDASTVGFFHSPEFLNKNLSNEEYIKVLYRTFLDRECDIQGYYYWLNNLNSGMSRDEVLRGFSNSVEFAKIMKDCGL